MPDQFVHLHVHTEYSMLDGAARLKDLFSEAKRLDMPALAMTDHGNLFGAYDFFKQATGAGVKPIIGCLVAGQEIVTADGVKQVEDVRVGDRVLTHKGRFRPVTATMRRPYEGRAYRVVLAGRYGRTLTLTEEHPILVRDAAGIVDWRKPGDIDAEGAWVCLPRLSAERDMIALLPLLPEGFRAVDGALVGADEARTEVPAVVKLDADFAYLLGLYAAEGSLRVRDGALTGDITFSLDIDERHLADRITALLARFGTRTRVHERADRGLLEVEAGNVPLAYVFSALVGEGAHHKRVPEQILTGPREAREGFLDGLLDGDGRAPTTPGRNRNLTTASRSLAWGARTLLADLGHFVSVSSGVVQGGDVRTRQDERVRRWYIVSFAPGRAHSRTIEDELYVYRPVADVVELALETVVYNFEVEEDNSYVSDFILHNCEMYLTPNSDRRDRTRVRWADGGENDVSGGGAYTHMTMLAQDAKG